MMRCDFCNTVMNNRSSGMVNDWRCPTCQARYYNGGLMKGPDPGLLRSKAEDLEGLANLFENRGRDRPIRTLVAAAKEGSR